MMKPMLPGFLHQHLQIKVTFISLKMFHLTKYTVYRHTSLYRASLYRTPQIMCFLQIEGLWQPCVEQVYWHNFFNIICLRCVTFW